MDFEAIIDKECPAPIHWLTHRRYVIGRVKYEVEKRDTRIQDLERAVEALTKGLEEITSWTNLAAHRGIGGHGPSQDDLLAAVTKATAIAKKARTP